MSLAATARTRIALPRRRLPTRVLLAAALLAAVGLGAAATASGQGSSSTRAAPATVDIDFARAMIAHHYQAIAMVDDLGDRGSPTIRALAAGILRKQLDEIGRMEGWLTLWNTPAVAPAHSTASDHDSTFMADPMTGMADATRLTKLQRARGPAADGLFLQLMIDHHRGGIDMAAYATGHANLTQVRDLAARMILDQNLEIRAMQQMLHLPTPSAHRSDSPIESLRPAPPVHRQPSVP